MKIRIQVSPPLGQPFAWTYAGTNVRIGRNPQCELAFGDECDTVSWEHARIELKSGGVFISDAKSTNGTFVNDRRLETRAMLRTGDIIRLGKGGPELRLLSFEGSSAAVQGPQQTDAGLMAPSEQRRQNAQGVQTGGPDANPQPHISTTRMLFIAARRNQRSFVAVGSVLAVLIIAILAVGLRNQAGQASKLSETEQQLLQLSEASINVQEICNKYAQAIYLVAFRLPNGKLLEFGTAFALDREGNFGTNAHVAMPIAEFLAGTRTGELGQLLDVKAIPLLVSQGGEQQYEIVRARWHPLYRRMGGNVEMSEVTYGTPDVGVLSVRLPAGRKLPVAVELASDAELHGLQPGTPLAYIGFPVFEDVLLTYSELAKVEPRTYQGHIVRLLTLDKQVGSPANRQLIEHTMLSHGGASGSPIFNREGKVVGVHYSASIVELRAENSAVRVSTPASPKWAIRTDLLREIYPSSSVSADNSAGPVSAWSPSRP
jgi:hypothetical protein